MLLGTILDDYTRPKGPVVRGRNEEDDYLQIWEDFSYKITHDNRWFLPSKEKGIARLEDSIKNFRDNIGTKLPENDDENNDTEWYRARVGDKNGYKIEDMGPPPPEKSTAGRANPAGIPYLYLANDPATALAEVRPMPGSYVTVAKFRKISGVFADLRAPKASISPLGLKSAEHMQNLANLIPFLERLGKELSTPILPQDTDRRYVPLQYFSEFLKSLNFKGVLFKSSIESGVNLTMFRYEELAASSVEVHIVDSVKIETKKLG